MPLFPDCMFAEGENAEMLEAESGMKLDFRPVSPENERFLKELCQNKRHLPMSVGYIKDGRTYVTSGPLRGKEEWIRKIDRHKRLAKVELPDRGEMAEMYMGLEIVSKE